MMTALFSMDPPEKIAGMESFVKDLKAAYLCSLRPYPRYPQPQIHPRPLVVVAATYTMYRLYCRERGLHPTLDARYANTYERVMGLSREGRYTIVPGTYSVLAGTPGGIRRVRDVINVLRAREYTYVPNK